MVLGIYNKIFTYFIIVVKINQADSCSSSYQLLVVTFSYLKIFGN